jgi:hypothetical protein
MSDENRGWKPADELPPDDRIVLALWMTPHDGFALVLARHVHLEAGGRYWRLVERPKNGNTDLGGVTISWWHELPDLPQGVEIIKARPI